MSNSFMSRKVFLASVVVISIATAMMVLTNSNKQLETPEERGVDLDQVSLQLKWLHYTGFGVHYIAQTKGLFKEQGLAVDIKQGGPGIDPIRMVASGEVDFGLASFDQILLARSKGIPLLAIFEDTIKSGVGFMSLAEKGISDPMDLEGKTVATLPGTDKHTIYEALLAKSAVNREKIEEIPSKFDLSLLFTGKVDAMPAFISNQPLIAEARGFDVNIIDPVDFDIDPGGNVIFVTESFAAQNAELISRFLSAERTAAEIALSIDANEVADMALEKSPKLDKELESKIWIATRDILLNPDIGSIGYMSEEKWRRTNELFISSQMLPSTSTKDNAYTNKFISD